MSDKERAVLQQWRRGQQLARQVVGQVGYLGRLRRHCGCGVVCIAGKVTRVLRWARQAAPSLVVSGALVLALQAPAVHGSAIVVTTFSDEDDGTPGGGSGLSLREAIRYSASGATI